MNRMGKLTLIFALISLNGFNSALAGTISVQPSTQTVNSGQSFSIAVDATSVTDLFAFQFDLSFDPTILSAVSVTEGAFLPSGGNTAFLAGTINNSSGTISFNADSLIGAISGVTGSGVLLNVQFTAIGSGTSGVNLGNLSLLDSTLSDITATSTNGSVTVQGSATPEPQSIALIGIGICVLAFSVSRRLLLLRGV